MSERVFAFFDVRSYGPMQFCCGPWYTAWRDIIGSKPCYTAEELLKLGKLISATTQGRIKAAKIGSKVKAHYLHSTGDMYFVCCEKSHIEQIAATTQEIGRLSMLKTEAEKQLAKLIGQMK
jgi:hypothetical protein